jgi:hypothetical protein
MNNIENQKMEELNEARNETMEAEEEDAGGPVAKAEIALSFGEKISQHWLILAAAAFFDLLGLIPFIGVVFNFLFGLVLFLYFGSKKKTAGSELMKIALPIGLGSIIDFFVGVLPVNIGAALIRIALS